MWPPEAEPLPRDSMLLARAVLPARRFTRSLALGRSSGSFCKQSRTSCASSYVQSSGTLQKPLFTLASALAPKLSNNLSLRSI